jgi:hypothetical protein
MSGDQESKLNPKPVEQVGPHMGTQKRVKERLNRPEVPSTLKRPRTTELIKFKQYCVSLKTNPKGLMVQCNTCSDWLHPVCVGVN